jgi:hypothetical protein
MNKTYLLKNRWLLTKIAVGTSLAIALGRKLLKGSPHPGRSTKPADGLTTEAFELACSNGITFRAARQELKNSEALHISGREREHWLSALRITARRLRAGEEASATHHRTARRFAASGFGGGGFGAVVG